MIIKTDIQIRFADVDILGHVNNVNLQHYFDLGKSEWFREVLGHEASAWKQTGLITVSTSTSYMAQTRMADQVFVTTELAAIGNKSFTVRQSLIGREDGIVRAESITVLVVFDFQRQQSVEIPADWRQKMEKVVGPESRK